MKSFPCQAAITEKRYHVGACIRTKHEDKFQRCWVRPSTRAFAIFFNINLFVSSLMSVLYESIRLFTTTKHIMAQKPFSLLFSTYMMAT